MLKKSTEEDCSKDHPENMLLLKLVNIDGKCLTFFQRVVYFSLTQNCCQRHTTNKLNC
jgi:hypothetical protein